MAVTPTQDECFVQIKSKSSLWTTTQDWGSNRKNVEDLVRAIINLKCSYYSGDNHDFQERYSRNHGDRYKDETAKGTKPNNPYDILNIKPSASKNEIVEAYRKMVKMYHPDRVSGLGPEFKELAEERIKIINGAYEELIRNFN